MPCPTVPYPALSYPNLLYPTLLYPTLTYRTLPYPTVPYLTLPYPTLLYPTPHPSPPPQSHLSNNCGGVDVGSSESRLQNGRAGQELSERNRRPLNNTSIEHRDSV